MSYLYYNNIYGCQPWQSGDIPRRAPTHKVTSSLNHLVFWGHVTYWIPYISTCTRPLATKHGNVKTQHQGSPLTYSHNPLTMFSEEVRWQTENIISAITMLMVTRTIKLVAYQPKFPAINLHDPSIRWWWVVIRQIKYIIFQSAEDPWTPNYARSWLTVRASHPWSRMTLWSREQLEITWQFEKLIFQPSEDLWLVNLAGCYLVGRG